MTSNWQLGLFPERIDEAGSALNEFEPVALECDDAAFEGFDVSDDDAVAMRRQAIPDDEQLAFDLFAEHLPECDEPGPWMAPEERRK